MQNVLVIYYRPEDVMDVTPDTTDEEIKKNCFRARKYPSGADALWAYANTPAEWSTLIEENDPNGLSVHAFIDEAYEHIKRDDYDWLCANFT